MSNASATTHYSLFITHPADSTNHCSACGGMGRCSAANKSEDLPVGNFSNNAFGRKAFVLIVFVTHEVTYAFSTIHDSLSEQIKRSEHAA